ncbi:MAG: GatB/YqeY domain-containing protein [Anaerolineae bacterium]|nr:GatB/YqeY domain-containing protein [Anaerolineae bacterium]
MSIQDQLMADLKDALRERDAVRKGALRLALAALKNARVEKNADLTDDEAIVVMSKEVKQRRDSIGEYEKAGRDDLVAAEAAEIEILNQYLPRALGREEIVELAREAIAETGASGPKQMGQVMRVLMPRVQGQADGRMVSEVVRGLLTSATA